MIDVIVTILILYLLYKLIFDFIVPVSKTTSHFKSQVNEMRRQQEARMQQQQQTPPKQPNKTSPAKNSTTTDGEYIDFEEVK
jgi:hypothetical protein